MLSLQVRHPAELNPLVVDPKTAMDKIPRQTQHTHMVGILFQLSELAASAATIFTELMKEAEVAHARMRKLGERIRTVSDQQTQNETFIKTLTLDKLLEFPRSIFVSDKNTDSRIFRRDNLSTAVQREYDAAMRPPKLEVLDQFMENGQKALKLYTNPDFFIDEWVSPFP